MIRLIEGTHYMRRENQPSPAPHKSKEAVIVFYAVTLAMMTATNMLPRKRLGGRFRGLQEIGTHGGVEGAAGAAGSCRELAVMGRGEGLPGDSASCHEMAEMGIEKRLPLTA